MKKLSGYEVRDWMFVRNKKKIYIEHPCPDDFEIETIAQSLAMVPRFCGQTKVFWSVASHSMLVSSLCPPQYKLYGLLHDASEAYLTDIPRPIKYHPSVIQVYGPLEDKFMNAIALKFGFSMDEKAHDIIKEYDDIVGRTEIRDLVDMADDFQLSGETLPDINLLNHSMPWEQAKDLFLKTYYAIKDKLCT